MVLHERDRPDQQIVASTNEIQIQQQMVSHQTVDPLIIGNGIPGPELNQDLLGRLPGYNSFHFAEVEDIPVAGEELKLRIKFGSVGQRYDPVAKSIQLYLSKINRLRAEGNSKTLRLALAVYVNLVPTIAQHPEFGQIVVIAKLWSVYEFDAQVHLRRNRTLVGIHGEEVIRELGCIFNYAKCCWHL